MVQLRDYQNDAVAQVRAAFKAGKKRPLLVSPTGSGKTVVFAYITRNAALRNKSVTILVHRAELVQQVSAALSSFAVPHGVIAPGRHWDPRHLVHVASVMTLIKRIDEIPPPDLVVIDEAHHTTLKTAWGRIVATWAQSKVLGVTATPCRLSGEGLGEVFDAMILGPTTLGLIDAGMLSPLRTFCPPSISTAGIHTRGGDFISSELSSAVNRPHITGNAVKHYTRYTPGKSAVVFCVSVAHAVSVAEEFTAAGYLAVPVDGGLHADVRHSIVEDYSEGKIQVLTSCDLISEGFDCGRIEVGISLRPTMSLGLWRQQCGRLLRLFPGKEHAWLFDHAGNSRLHGLPTDDVEWDLEGEKKSGKKNVVLSPRVCKQCFAASPAGSPVCAECGYPFPAAPARKLVELEGELIEVDPDDPEFKRRVQEAQLAAQSLEDLKKFGRAMGHRPGWAEHVWAGRQKKAAGRKPVPSAFRIRTNS